MYCTKVTWFEFAADRKCKYLVNISQHFVVENVAVFGELCSKTDTLGSQDGPPDYCIGVVIQKRIEIYTLTII